MKKLISVLLCIIMLFGVLSVGTASVSAAQKQTAGYTAASVSYNPGSSAAEKTGLSRAIYFFTNAYKEIVTQIFNILLDMIGFDIGDFLE